MDWNLAIERNRAALKRILAALVAMAGLAGLAIIQSPPLRGRCPAGQRGVSGANLPHPPLSAEPVLGLAEGQTRGPTYPPQGGRSDVVTLPRHLHRAVLRLLRPAEAAVRRLIIIAAREIVVRPSACPCKPNPDPQAAHAVLRNLGIAVVLSPADLARAAAEKRAAEKRAVARNRAIRGFALPLLDPLPPRPGRPRYVPAHAAPRILSFDGARPHRLPPPPSPDDPIDSTRLGLRLAALASALDDLPGCARRFARWKARRDAAAAQNRSRDAAGGPNRQDRASGRFRRLSPLRPGRPPGLSAATRRRPSHEVHEVLADLQCFAYQALQQPDTS